jgi:hypothetical protein
VAPRQCNFSIIDPWLIIISMLRSLLCSIGLHSGVAFVTPLYYHSGARVEENTPCYSSFLLGSFIQPIYLRVACTRAVLHCWWHNAAVLRIHKINAKRVQVQQQGTRRALQYAAQMIICLSASASSHSVCVAVACVTEATTQRATRQGGSTL